MRSRAWLLGVFASALAFGVAACLAFSGSSGDNDQSPPAAGDDAGDASISMIDGSAITTIDATADSSIDSKSDGAVDAGSDGALAMDACADAFLCDDFDHGNLSKIWPSYGTAGGTTAVQSTTASSPPSSLLAVSNGANGTFRQSSPVLVQDVVLEGDIYIADTPPSLVQASILELAFTDGLSSGTASIGFVPVPGGPTTTRYGSVVASAAIDSNAPTNVTLSTMTGGAPAWIHVVLTVRFTASNLVVLGHVGSGADLALGNVKLSSMPISMVVNAGAQVPSAANYTVYVDNVRLTRAN